MTSYRPSKKPKDAGTSTSGGMKPRKPKGKGKQKPRK